MKKKAEPTNQLEEAAQQLVSSNIESAVSNLTYEIVSKAVESVKNNIKPNKFMHRLTRLKEKHK